MRRRYRLQWGPSTAARTDLGSCRMGNCNLGSSPWENAFEKVPNTKITPLKCITRNYAYSSCKYHLISLINHKLEFRRVINQKLGTLNFGKSGKKLCLIQMYFFQILTF